MERNCIVASLLMEPARSDLPCSVQLHIQLQVHATSLENGLVCFHQQCCDIGSTRSTHIDDVVGVPLGDLGPAVDPALHPGLLNEAAGLMAWRILKDGPRVALRGFCHLTVTFVLGKRFAQLLWLLGMQLDTQARDDFCWLDHATQGQDELTAFIKAHLSLVAKAAVAVPKVKFIM